MISFWNNSLSNIECNEYKEFVYDTIYTSNGLENPPIITKIENCAFTSIALIVGGTQATEMEFPHMVRDD